jgi:hypothetical protein
MMRRDVRGWNATSVSKIKTILIILKYSQQKEIQILLLFTSVTSQQSIINMVLFVITIIIIIIISNDGTYTSKPST